MTARAAINVIAFCALIAVGAAPATQPKVIERLKEQGQDIGLGMMHGL